MSSFTNKSYILIFSVFVMFQGFGCYATQSKDSENEQTTISESADSETGETLDNDSAETVLWIRKPFFEGNHLLDMGSYVYEGFSQYIEEKHGYPITWHGNQTVSVVAITGDNTVTTIDFDGKIHSSEDVAIQESSDFLYYVWQEERAQYIFGIVGSNYSVCYNDDFSVSEKDVFINPVGYDGPFRLSVYNGILGYAELSDQKNFIPYNSEEAHGHITAENRFLCSLVDDEFHEAGTALCSSDGTVFFEIPNFMPHALRSIFVNGFCVLASNPYYDENNKYGYINADTGENITGFYYDECKWFEDGYAPVRKDNAWAFVDTEGRQVTDFVFEDAGTLFEGKVFVRINGLYGIIDLKQTLNNTKYLSNELLQNSLD